MELVAQFSRILADVEVSDVRHLDDQRLTETTSRLTEMEHEISQERAAVQHVLDRFAVAVAERIGTRTRH